VKYLLDVNALVALGYEEHAQHERVARWERALSLQSVPAFATCPITELGFVRILAQVPVYGFTVAQARELLRDLKADASVKFTFLSDDHDATQLPDWVVRPEQTTDGHLAQLAKANGAVLATMDAKIPGAYLIPA
jgi:predicted nucleic acid-binding protein